MSSEVKITISGPIGGGKSALMVEIAEFLRKKHELIVVYSDPDRAQVELNMGMVDPEFRSDTIKALRPIVMIEEVIQK